MTGQTKVDIVAPLDQKQLLYPAHLFHKVKDDYGKGWNIRHDGKRLTPEQRENISMLAGWRDGQAYSEAKGGKPPPKGWGHAQSRTYLKTEDAWRHLKILSIRDLAT